MRQQTPNKIRRLAILERAAGQWGCSCNIEHAFAGTDEPQMKYLLRKKYVTLQRDCALRLGGKGVTRAIITSKGRKYLKDNAPLSQR